MGAHLVSVDCWPDTPCATKVCGRTLRRVNGDLSCLHQLSLVLAVMPARQHVTKFVCERPLRPMQDCGESNASHERSTTQQTVLVSSQLTGFGWDGLKLQRRRR